MVAIENVYLTFETPKADLPIDDFMIADEEERERGLLWARGIIADFVHYDDDTILRAGKVICANDPAGMSFVGKMVEIIEGKRDAA